jgi:hypothetical protein
VIKVHLIRIHQHLTECFKKMRSKLKPIFVSILLFLISTSAFAQPYETGIGVRLGGITSGITVKHYTGSRTALEGIVSFGRHSFLITGLYEKHQQFPNAEGLSWFFGGGAHIGFFDENYGSGYYYYKYRGNKVIVFDDSDSGLSFGADFIIGLDYKFKNAPVNLALDLKPFVDIVPGFYGYWEGALTIRFTL